MSLFRTKKFPFYKQLDQMDCGPTCLKMIAKYYGKNIAIEELRELSSITQQGVTLGGIADASESIGIRTFGAKINYSVLANETPLPCIVNWRQRHYVIVHKITKNQVHVADPAFGLIVYSKEKFLEGWTTQRTKDTPNEGIVLLLEPTPSFYKLEDEKNTGGRFGLEKILLYFKNYKKEITQIFISLTIVSGLQLALPFLTQSLVDFGINDQNVRFVNLVLVAQLTLFISISLAQIIRDWFLMYMTSRVNIQMLSDFLIKLMKLPLSYINSKNFGDILQRLQDHSRLQNYVSSSSFNAIFSFVTIISFSIILGYFNLSIFTIFWFGTIIFIVWTLLLLKKRKILDYKFFDLSSGNQSSVIQLLHGMHEIKLNGSERRRRWEWEAIQAKTYDVLVKNLKIQQAQVNIGNFINEVKNIFITFFAASAVIDGNITLGSMLSIQYIIGQLNVPVNNLVSFIQSTQDAGISLKRINEIHALDDEVGNSSVKKNAQIPETKTLKLSQLDFRYGSNKSPLVLQDLNLLIPANKTTAIVGPSGSGKTTLINLLLKTLAPKRGNIYVDNTDLTLIDAKAWRSRIGVVLQEGFIFSDSIIRNITESDSEGLIDKDRLRNAIEIANLSGVIDSFPRGLDTRIGASGVGLSGGQKQRILIARALYKNPDYFFLDEATSSLDASNEKDVMEKLHDFFLGRTVVIVAHRLSTVINADKIVVLDKGKIVEEGDHESLVNRKGLYFNLIKDQLELGV